MAPCHGGWRGQAKKEGLHQTCAVTPNFTLKDLSGKAVRLSDFRGKVVLLDFWAAWCDSCLSAGPYYEKLHKRHGSSSFAMVGINEGERAKTVEAFVKKNNITYPVLLDSNKEAFDACGIRGLPSAVLIDDEGKIRGRWAGFDDAAASNLEKSLNALLTKKP